MDIRKFAAVAGLAAGAALTFAPLASADDLTTTLDGEISSLNSLFSGEVALAGDPATDISGGTTAGSFETVPLSDTPQVAPLSTLDYELYGVDPVKAGIASDPGAYEVFNGASAKFDDAFNVALYALENNGALDTNAADFIGSTSSIDAALAGGTATDAFDYFYNFAIGDLSGFFDTNLSFLDIGSAI
jgi:hypothetical protein